MSSMMAYAAQPDWALVHEPGMLLVHAGADELFLLDDVGDEAAAELLEQWRAPVMRPERLSGEAKGVFEQLKAARIVRNLIEPAERHALAIRFAGSRDDDLRAALADALPEAIGLVEDEDASDLVLVVRTDGRLEDVVEDDYASLLTPHLLLDLAYGHTISLGPLVFARETACLACLVGRLSYLWGDVAPPPGPRMTCHPSLSGGLAALAIAGILLREDRSLVNRTVAYDFGSHDARSDSVYRLPMCPCCATRVPDEGSVALPWAGAR